MIIIKKDNLNYLHNFIEKSNETQRLVEIHRDIAGNSVGRKHKVEVLNKSGIVLIVSAWEGFLEDLVTLAFNEIIKNCSDPKNLPTKIKSSISQIIRKDEDPFSAWKLAGSNWKNVVLDYGNDLMKKQIDYFHSPRPQNIDDLFHNLTGIRSISKLFKWNRNSNKNVLEKLNKLLDLRGKIAHSMKLDNPIYKSDFTDSAIFLIRLTAVTHNIMYDFMVKSYNIQLDRTLKPTEHWINSWK
ncbi:HEPN domain-containing protein [Leptospira levettii]|uniref:HEPN domain-containing protein n=1 Tax=Leptospira levettii TaxID=2023178 RepID=UPI001083F723|nr:HEPN domain-containing protein [Leptospira levettii]TGM33909.1 hypothetical protein EHQ71_00025 [Leptospira levettii]TGM85445.1 hypothetical protein EHR00_05125 [Leptospira levettii]